MLAAIDDAFNHESSLLGRFLTTTAHFMLYAVGAATLARIPFYLGIDHWTVRLAQFVAALLMLIGGLHIIHTRMCARCIADVPIDASARAEKERRVLRLNHALATKRGVGTYLGLIVAAVLANEVFGLPRVVYLPVDAAVVALTYSAWLHHRVRPWCPHCRPWDNGEGIRESSPDPVVKATR
ncbi:hypothetical protein [Nocardia noduli]|uniref:hypothetical protein n=1 Tax=Nocardia noduli TaxID=2815722 RepID=UPI001C240787|nr:hypothetical protein [Nocardia noduli]